MVRRKPRRKPLGTIWEISDELWRRIEPILLEFWPKKPTGRKVANWRKMLNAIIFRLRAAASGNHCPSGTDPRALSTTGSSAGLQQGSSSESGRSWSPSVTNSAGCSGSGSRPTRCWARPASGGKKTGKNPTDRGKKGTKKSLVTDGDGGPLGVVIAGANVLERRLLAATIESIVVERPNR